jgi:hypothetical protein
MVAPKKTAAGTINALPNPSAGHARLGPSGAKKWLSCPGSIVLEAQFPNKSSNYADEGTACHDIAARCLVDNLRASSFIGEYVVVSKADELKRTVEFTPELAELTQEYVDSIVGALLPDTQLWVEVKVDISTWLGVQEQFGTADVVTVEAYRGPDAQEGDITVGVDDAKFGRTPVPVDTPQLPLYALGVITGLMTGKMPPPVHRPARRTRHVIATQEEGNDDDLD